MKKNDVGTISEKKLLSGLRCGYGGGGVPYWTDVTTNYLNLESKMAVDFECLSCGSCGESMPLSEEKPSLSDWSVAVDVTSNFYYLLKYRVRRIPYFHLDFWTNPSILLAINYALWRLAAPVFGTN